MPTLRYLDVGTELGGNPAPFAAQLRWLSRYAAAAALSVVRMIAFALSSAR